MVLDDFYPIKVLGFLWLLSYLFKSDYGGGDYFLNISVSEYIALEY